MYIVKHDPGKPKLLRHVTSFVAFCYAFLFFLLCTGARPILVLQLPASSVVRKDDEHLGTKLSASGECNSGPVSNLINKNRSPFYSHEQLEALFSMLFKQAPSQMQEEELTMLAELPKSTGNSIIQGQKFFVHKSKPAAAARQKKLTQKKKEVQIKSAKIRKIEPVKISAPSKGSLLVQGAKKGLPLPKASPAVLHPQVAHANLQASVDLGPSIKRGATLQRPQFEQQKENLDQTLVPSGADSFCEDLLTRNDIVPLRENEARSGIIEVHDPEFETADEIHSEEGIEQDCANFIKLIAERINRFPGFKHRCTIVCDYQALHSGARVSVQSQKPISQAYRAHIAGSIQRLTVPEVLKGRIIKFIM